MAGEIKVAFSGARRAGSFFKAFQVHPETEIVALCATPTTRRWPSPVAPPA